MHLVGRERRGGFERRPTMSMPPHTAALVRRILVSLTLTCSLGETGEGKD
jgi:hypothetical protein